MSEEVVNDNRSFVIPNPVIRIPGVILAAILAALGLIITILGAINFRPALTLAGFIVFLLGIVIFAL